MRVPGRSFLILLIAGCVTILLGMPTPRPAIAQDAAEWKGFEEGYALVQRGARLLARGATVEGKRALRDGRARLLANIDAYPNYGPNYYALAIADSAEDRDDSAQYHLEQCLERTPSYGPARTRLVRLFLATRREPQALDALEWFTTAEEAFDEQVDHFRTAALFFEDLGRHESAFICAREAWERDITKWVEEKSEGKSKRKDERRERKVDYSKDEVRRVLWLLAVNARVSGAPDTQHWIDELLKVPSVAKKGLPFGFRFLEVAEDLRGTSEEQMLSWLRKRLLDKKTVDTTLTFLYPEPKPDAPKPRRLRDGGPRPWGVYFRRMLGESEAEWSRFLHEKLPAHLMEQSEQVADSDPGESAALAQMSLRLSGEEPEPELLLFIAERLHADGAYPEAIEILNRALEMKPAYSYKYRKLRERCEREVRRFRPRR